DPERLAAGLEDVKWIPMDMHEFGLRKQFKEKTDSGGVLRRFEKQWPSVAPLQFFEKNQECLAPGGKIGFVSRSQGKVLPKFLLLPRKDPLHAARAQRTAAQSELVFLRRGQGQTHVVFSRQSLVSAMTGRRAGGARLRGATHRTL